jgi:hypothetical protein
MRIWNGSDAVMRAADGGSDWMATTETKTIIRCFDEGVMMSAGHGVSNDDPRHTRRRHDDEDVIADDNGDEHTRTTTDDNNYNHEH